MKFLQVAAIPGKLRAALLDKKQERGAGGALLTQSESGQKSSLSSAVNSRDTGGSPEEAQEQKINGQGNRRNAGARSEIGESLFIDSRAQAFRSELGGYEGGIMIEPATTLSDPRHIPG